MSHIGNRSAQVDEYLDAASAEHREALESLRELIHEIHPEVDGTIEYKVPTFKLRGGTVPGFASRARYISLYCKPEIVDEHRETLGKLNVGKGWIRFRKFDQLRMDTIREIIRESEP